MRDSISPFLAGVNALDSDPSRTSSPSNRSAQFLFSRGELLPLTVPSGAGRLYVPVSNNHGRVRSPTPPVKNGASRCDSFAKSGRILFSQQPEGRRNLRCAANGRLSFRFHESRWRDAQFKSQEKGYEKNIMRVSG